jgi:hypothetical protein
MNNCLIATRIRSISASREEDENFDMILIQSVYRTLSAPDVSPEGREYLRNKDYSRAFRRCEMIRLSARKGTPTRRHP